MQLEHNMHILLRRILPLSFSVHSMYDRVQIMSLIHCMHGLQQRVRTEHCRILRRLRIWLHPLRIFICCGPDVSRLWDRLRHVLRFVCKLSSRYSKLR